jgi:hypothetical protein
MTSTSLDLSSEVTTDPPPASTRKLAQPPTDTVVALLGALGVLAGVVCGSPLVLLLGLLASTSAVLLRWLPIPMALPMGLLVLLGAATVAGMLAGLRGIDLAASRGLLGAIYVAAAVGVTLSTRRQRAASSVCARTTRLSGLLFAPPLMALIVAALQGVGDRAAGWTLMGTDVAEHVVMLGDVQHAGALLYNASAYPRGLQMLLTLVALDAPPARSGELLTYDLRLYASTIWLTFAFFLLAAGALTQRLAIIRGLSPRASATSAALLGSALLSAGWIHATFIRMGSAPVFIALLAMWCLPALAMSPSERPVRTARFIVAGGVTTALIANLWQGLILVPLGAVSVYLLTREASASLNACRRRPTSHRGLVCGVGAMAALLLSAVVAWVPVGSLLAETSFSSLAAADGALNGPPLWLVAVSVAVMLAYLRTGPVALRALSLGAAGGALLLVTQLLVSSGHADLSQYYPRKALSAFVLLASPWVGAAAASAAVGTTRAVTAFLEPRLGRAQLLPWAFGAAGCMLVAGMIGPGLAGANSLLRSNLTGAVSTEGGQRRLDLALELERSHPNEIVVPSALGSSGAGLFPGSFVIAKLLRFQTGQVTNTGGPWFVCEDLAKVAAGHDAVIATDLPAAVLRRRMTAAGCGGIPVLHRDGGNADVVKDVSAALVAKQQH